jgi:hypothetical protein
MLSRLIKLTALMATCCLLTQQSIYAHHSDSCEDAGDCCDSSSSDHRHRIRADRVPGVYIAEVTGQPTFDSQGNIVGTSAFGRMVTLLPGGIAFFASSEFDTIGNKFPDPLSTVPSGLAEDNQQQPNFGTWVIEGKNKIRVMTFEFYFFSTTAQFDNMFFKAINRNSWLFAVDLGKKNVKENGYKELKLIESTLVEVDPPNDALDKNAPQTSAFRRSFTKENPLIIHRAPNFKNDLKNIQ